MPLKVKNESELPNYHLDGFKKVRNNFTDNYFKGALKQFETFLLTIKFPDGSQYDFIRHICKILNDAINGIELEITDVYFLGFVLFDLELFKIDSEDMNNKPDPTVH